MAYVMGFFSAFLLLRCLLGTSINNNRISQEGKFQGAQYWKPGFTQNVDTLYETSFARFQLHHVLLEDGTTVKDWMWYDEADNVNVLVETQQSTFLIFKQTKYGIPEASSLAVVGGLIEPGEDPLKAAQRELQEELGMTSSDWKTLGNFRAAANRGGTTFVFWVRRGR